MFAVVLATSVYYSPPPVHHSRRYGRLAQYFLRSHSMKLSDVAEKLSCRLEGEPSAEITGIAGMEHAAPGQITFLANRRYFPLLHTTRATAIFIEDGIRIEREPGLPPLAALRSNNPYLAFARAIELFYQPPVYKPGVHSTAVVAKSAHIGTDAHIGPYCVVDEEATIGDHAVLHSFVTIYRGAKIGDYFFAHAHAVVREHCRIGDRVILQNGDRKSTRLNSSH